MHARITLRFLSLPTLRIVTLSGLFAIAVPLLLLLPQQGMAQAPPTPHHPGHWTALQTWDYPAVHLALLPGDGVNHHSKLLWWHGSPAYRAYLEGGLWGWNWSSSADQCGSFGSFTALSVPKAPFDVFCAATTHLADGRAAIVGGTSAVAEIGIRNAAYFDPANNAWTELASPMASRRWYPSVQLMPRGELTAYSGSSYNHMLAWGGTSAPGTAGQAQGDLHRLRLTEASDWDPKVPHVPLEWPTKRFGHTLVTRGPGDAALIFGGLGVDGQYRNDVWWLSGESEPLQAEGRVLWTERFHPYEKPDPRSEHGAVVLNDGSLIVFGGRDEDEVFNEVWRHYVNPADNQWTWEELPQEPVTAGEPLPGARFGQAAIFQRSLDPPVRDRALVFGGATGLTGQLADGDVWELTVDLTPFAHKAKWRKLTLESGSPAPAPRYDHAMAADPYVRRRLISQLSPCMWRMFVSGGRGAFGASGLSDEFWQLWDVDLNTVAWTQMNAGPSARAGHSLTYDGRHYLVLMGGDTGAATSSDQVWEMPVQCPSIYGGNCESCDPAYYEPTWSQASPTTSTALSGHTARFGGWVYARKPERLTPASGSGGSWQTLNAPLLQEWYPFQFTIAAGPNAGKVFNAGPSDASYLLDPAGPSWTAFPAAGSEFRGGSAVRYRPDRVMKCGTRDTEEAGEAAVRTTKYIALDGATPAWIASADMDSGRVNHNLTILPSGEVLVNGGTELVSNTGNQGRSRALIELWRPPDATYPNGVWYGGSGANALETTTAARDYHSVSILLPDARVLCASGEKSPQKQAAQIYCPPYLFNANGMPATRPVISWAPSAITYGEAFQIETPTAGGIASVCLMRPGAATHGFNQDQLYIPLSFAPFPDYSALRAVAPVNGRVAPPGDYLLFILSASGVPAVAKWVRLGQCPTIPCDTGSPPQADFYADIVTPNDVYLVWYAPGDDITPLSGSYDLRMSATGIASEQVYATATPFTDEPPVQPQGTPINHPVHGLTECTPYFFGLKTRDGIGPSFKNWSLLSPITVTTTCGGGPSGGSRAERVDEGRVAGGASATPVSPSEEAAAPGVTAGSAIIASSAALAAASSLDTGVGLLEAETRRTREGGWQVTLRRVAETQGIEVGDADAIVSQVRDEVGNWRTLGRHRPTPGKYPLGLCALRDRGRVVFPAGYGIDRVAPGLRSRGQECAMSAAQHSRSGAMGGQFVADGGSVEMAIGDVLTLTYDHTGERPAGEISCYLQVRATGSAVTPASATGRRLEERVPTRFTLHQNQPNPTGRSTVIGFDLPVASPVSLEVFDLQGRRVATLAQGEHPAGSHAVEWDLRSADGVPVRAGVYLYRLTAKEFRAQRKLSVVP